MNKEISDALHFLLHCSLKAVGYETQREQFEFIYKYIENLEKENQSLKKQLEKQNQKYKEVIDKLKDKTKENIENAKCEITTLTIGDKAYYQYIEKILDNYVDILKEVE